MNRKLSSLLLGIAVAALAACAESDTSISNKVRTKIETDRDVGASHIEIASAGHVVTLTGTVDSEAGRAKVLKLARDTEGVKDVKDRLTVVPGSVAAAPATGSPEPGTPAAPVAGNDALASAVKARLAADKKVAGDPIQVEAQGDVVILTGTVHSEEEKDQALKVALETQGVQRVENRLTISVS